MLPSNISYVIPEDRFAWLEENLAGQGWDVTRFVFPATFRMSIARRIAMYFAFILADLNLHGIDLFKSICSVDVKLYCTEDSSSLISPVFKKKRLN